MSLTFIFFVIVGILAIASAFVTVTSKNPIVSAMALVVHFFMLAGLYLTLAAQFLAVIQVLVYAGAIMVLVIFVIMLLNLEREEQLKEKFNYRKILAIIFGAALVFELVMVFRSYPFPGSTISNSAREIGTVQSIGSILFKDYLFPFEAISLLLLVAIVGSVVLAKRKVD